MTYNGQPEYVVVGYLCDLFEPWAEVEGSEWSDYLRSLSSLISACITVSNEERAAELCGWFRNDLEQAFAEDWWGMADEYEADIWRAQDEFERITAYWRERAVSFRGEAALETAIADLPAWIRPDPERPPKPNPEIREYERLKEKFGA